MGNTKRASFNQNQVSPTCCLCKEEDGMVEHFMLHCPVLSPIRQPILEDIRLTCIQLGTVNDLQDSEHLLELILISTAVFKQYLDLVSVDFDRLERHTKRLCHALHTEQYKRLPQMVNKWKHQGRKGGPSANARDMILVCFKILNRVTEDSHFNPHNNVNSKKITSTSRVCLHWQKISGTEQNGRGHISMIFNRHLYICDMSEKLFLPRLTLWWTVSRWHISFWKNCTV